MIISFLITIGLFLLMYLAGRIHGVEIEREKQTKAKDRMAAELYLKSLEIKRWKDYFGKICLKKFKVRRI